MIEGEIIPRLLLAHAAPDMGPPAITSDEIERLARLSISLEPRAAADIVLDRMDAGARSELIALDLLAPAARLLGDWWEDDRCSFAEVTLGLCRLQQLAYEVFDRATPTDASEGLSALFAMAPGEQHALGLVLVTETFRLQGWRAEAVDSGELLQRVEEDSVSLVGLSVVDEQWLGGLPDFIARARSVSRNGNLKVLVGGRVFAERPALFALVGADGTAENAPAAERLAASMVEEEIALA